jgi:hypothetical protein
VTVDFALLATLPAQIEVNFPDRSSVTLNRSLSENLGGQSFTWGGKGGECSGTFTALGGALRGTLACANSIYDITAPRSGAQQLLRYDPSQAHGENEAEAVPNIGPSSLEEVTNTSAEVQGADDALDVLVLYTNGVIQGTAGGLPPGSVERPALGYSDRNHHA